MVIADDACGKHAYIAGDYQHGTGLEEEVPDREYQTFLVDHYPCTFTLGAQGLGGPCLWNGFDAELYDTLQGYGVSRQLRNRHVGGTPGGQRCGKEGDGHDRKIRDEQGSPCYRGARGGATGTCAAPLPDAAFASDARNNGF